jgi:ABC-type transporter Mla subunit MlaD
MSGITSLFKGLRSKILFLVLLPMLVIGGISTLSFQKLAGLSEQLTTASLVRLPLAQYSGDMDSAVNGTMRWLWTVVSSEGMPEDRRLASDQTKKELERLDDAYSEYMKLPRSDRMKALFKGVEDNVEGFKSVTTEILARAELGTPKDFELARQLIRTKLRPHARSMNASLDEMDRVRKELAREQAQQEIAEAVQARNTLLTVAILSSLILLILGYLISSRLVRSLSTVTEKIADSGTQVSSASSQLSSASQQLSAGATEAASSLEETVSSLEELSSMVKLNADNAKEASSLSQSSRKSAEDGESEIRSLIGAMTEISQSSKKIEEIINVIDDIAFQTNLLALNAAVEAARAGEQGKGFAVVAEAVRNLAQRSASAAKDITVLIKESVDKISHGSRIADQSGEVLKNIVTSVKKVSDLNNEIASASAEQSNGISQITKAMNELDQATQRNAASAEETAAASEEMSAQSTELQRLVIDLSVVISGDATHHVARPGVGTGGGNSPRQHAKPPRLAHAPSSPKLKVVQGGGSAAEKAIPFDEDAPSTAAPAPKVGNLDGF